MSEPAEDKNNPEPTMANVFKGSCKEKFVPGEDENKRMIKQLVSIAVDGSEHSKRAVNWYITEMHKETNKIAFIHILSVPDVDVTTDEHGELVLVGKWQESAKESYKKSQELLNSYKNLCEAKQIPYEIHLGSKQKHRIGAEIIRIVEERGIMWLIVGTRGLDTLRRTILGSVSDFLLHHSPIPITIVPPP